MSNLSDELLKPIPTLSDVVRLSPLSFHGVLADLVINIRPISKSLSFLY